MREPGEPQLDKEEVREAERQEALAPEALQESRETIDGEAYLENAKNAGALYKELIGEMVGGEPVDEKRFEEFDEKTAEQMKNIVAAAKDHLREQHLQAELEGMGAKEMLTQAFPGEEHEEVLQDESNYRMEELREGMFVVYIKSAAFRQLGRGARAFCAKMPKGVSFLVLPEYANAEAQRREAEENIPHEANHLLSHFAEKDGLMPNNEEHELWQKTFAMYREELLCKLGSDGNLDSYIAAGPERRQTYQKAYPKEYAEVLNKEGELNDFLRTVAGELQRVGMSREDLVLPVFKATTFEELEQNLREAKDVIAKQASTEEFSAREGGSPGWGAV